MAYTVHQAKTQFSRLLKEAEAGQEVIVMRGKKPVARIVAIEDSSAKLTRCWMPGAYAGLVHAEDSAFDPLTDGELAEMGFNDLLEGDLVSPPQ